ncbi:response regulator [Pedobacter sp. HDW13]|uniref:hybrid sensor histidine kinase/response regulator transcription factor n=1 Tax=Pedobacter sp. HDW13 TaxID=2714940 RepID=UPI001409275D|nr:two-component regulator propeller domain-containing protein [Pedobacter sp. HDW13]QIL38357.1 response regulator [Pedobacter sp. HDW13]
MSNNSVLSINQDTTGYIWLGTKYGLNRFDGRTFRIFKNDPQNTGSISSNDFIKCLEIRNDQRMWVINSGLDLYNPVNESFEHIMPIGSGITKIVEDKQKQLWIASLTGLKFIAANSKKIIPIQLGKGSNEVSEIFEDRDQHIWVGTSVGLYELFFSNKKLKVLLHQEAAFDVFYGNQIKAIAQDKNGNLWFGTKTNGIQILNMATKKISHFAKNGADKRNLVNNNIRKIISVKNGKMWIGTQDGLSIGDPDSFTFQHYQHDVTDANSLSQNSIHDIFQDKDGSVWIGTFFGGVNVVYAVNTPFKSYQNNLSPNSISSSIVSAIVEDKQHNLWVGTEAGGLNYFNRQSNQFISYKNSPADTNSLSSNLVKSIAIDQYQHVLIGTSVGGLSYFDPQTGKFTVYKRKGIGNNSNNIASDNVNCLLVSRGQQVLVGTDEGLNLFDPLTKHFQLLNLAGSNSRFNKKITALFQDRQNKIWIGTPAGLYSLSPNLTIQPENYKGEPDHAFKLNINCIQQDSEGNIWLGTYHKGLALLNQRNKTFELFNYKNNLPSDNILSLVEDNQNNLWIGTDNGLVKYDRKARFFRSFNMLDGLPDNQFNTSSFYKAANGALFFGTFNGLVTFDPQKIEKNNTAPQVVLSNLKLFNNPVKINDETRLLTEDINLSKNITFNHLQNNFTLEFSALNFIKPSKNKYAYKLEGFESNWNNVEVPTATYTNLSAGTYTFLVKATNNDGIWSREIKSVTITVLPPIWKTIWAYLLYAIAIYFIVAYIIKFFKAKAKLKQELYLEHIEAEHQKKNYQMKLDFFTNISHEIRTPLTLILGPLEKLEEITTNNTVVHQYALTIKNNTERLYRLVNELLDFRKADSENLRLYFAETDIVAFLRGVFENFAHLAEAKNITYTFKTTDEAIPVYFDKNQMEKVFFNLLSNAFKFTPADGEISLVIEQNCLEQVSVTVNDNGKGIALYNIDDIFKNFYQEDQSMGTGIGLALSKKLVELHQGEVMVNSRLATANERGFTAFKVLLQLGNSHLTGAYTGEAAVSEAYQLQHEPDYATESPLTETTAAANNNKPSVLIVEDNKELRDFIKQSLANDYDVQVSENGLQGWEIASTTLPDLIISDIMMPVMDGLTFCKKIKTDVRTSHIPVILLTAKSAQVHEIQGLEHGADVYITKPFSNKILQLNIHNMLALKTAMQKKYSDQLQLPPIIQQPNASADEKLLSKLQLVIEENLANADFDIVALTLEIGMSKSVLYKKFSALTNLSLNEFIKTQRLKHAVTLLQQGETSILSVAVQVGFNDVKYFSREFKKVYGITPSHYIKN